MVPFGGDFRLIWRVGLYRLPAPPALAICTIGSAGNIRLRNDFNFSLLTMMRIDTIGIRMALSPRVIVMIFISRLWRGAGRRVMPL